MFSDKHKIIYFRLFNNLNLDIKERSEINKKVIIIRIRHGKRFLLTTARKRFQNALLRSREQKEKKNSTDKTYIQSSYIYLQHSSFQK